MKVNQLFEQKSFSELQAKARKWSDEKWNHISALQKDPKHEFVGAGSFGYVSKQNDPHEMDKINRTAEVEEGGTIYQLAIYNTPQIQNNSFAPKIRSVDMSNPNYPVISLEPLVKYVSRSIISNEQVMETLLNKYFVDITTKGAGMMNGPKLVANLAWSIKNNGENIKDPELLQISNFINGLITKHDLGLDIHSENVMWRLTAQGPQLVITDPVAG